MLDTGLAQLIGIGYTVLGACAESSPADCSYFISHDCCRKQKTCIAPHYGKYRKEAGQLPAAGQAYAMLRFIFRMQKSK
jgi:hypothetical protein